LGTAFATQNTVFTNLGRTSSRIVSGGVNAAFFVGVAGLCGGGSGGFVGDRFGGSGCERGGGRFDDAGGAGGF
jgi:hypothetical protein